MSNQEITSTHGPITRTTLALFAGASGDHVPLHIDSDFAKSAGMDDVFAHGMLSMAYVGQLLTGHYRPEQLKEWSVRFKAITPLYATITCTAKPSEEQPEDGLRKLDIIATTDQGVVTLEGFAIVEEENAL